MFEIRFHGRGGQGVVTAAELICLAAFNEGRFAQAFPSFGSERTGAPVVSFCRISDTPIRTREPISHPDALAVQDVTLIHQVELFAGLGEDGTVVLNTSGDLESLGLSELRERLRHGQVLTVPATEIAREILGRPLPNAALLGGRVAATKIVRLDALLDAIRTRFAGTTGEKNALAAQAAYRHVAEHREEVGHAATA